MSDELDMSEKRERRVHKRLLCAELVEVTWSDRQGKQNRRVANLEDVSKSGLCLQLECAIYSGTEIRMSYKGSVFSGMVRYTVYRDNAYFIGIELDQENQWSFRRFAPEHLLDPDDVLSPAIHKGGNSRISSLVN
jgi:hypothetical protein